jgi:hypothetical protein
VENHSDPDRAATDRFYAATIHNPLKSRGEGAQLQAHTIAARENVIVLVCGGNVTVNLPPAQDGKTRDPLIDRATGRADTPLTGRKRTARKTRRP